MRLFGKFLAFSFVSFYGTDTFCIFNFLSVCVLLFFNLTIDGNCDLYSQSGYRLQFLGGYKENNDDEMCYEYKLHEYKHKKGLKKMVSMEDRITVSMQICDYDDANGIVSDYLTRVRLFNNNANDSYYIDNTHFYYINENSGNYGNDNDQDDPVIELCFSSDKNGKLVTETEYCIQHNNEKQLCSKRGIFMTNICNSGDSVGPPSDIDYIPIPGQLYKLSICLVFVLVCLCVCVFVCVVFRLNIIQISTIRYQ